MFTHILLENFLKCIFDVRELFSTDEIASKSLTKFGNYLREIQTLFSVRYFRWFEINSTSKNSFEQNLLEQTSYSILKTLTRMLKEDIKKIKDQGKLFERLSSDYDIGKIYINKIDLPLICNCSFQRYKRMPMHQKLNVG